MRPHRPLPPTGIQLAYFGELRAILRAARELVRRRIGERAPQLSARAVEHLHADAPHPPGKRINQIVEQIRAALWRIYPQKRLERVAARIAQAVSAHQRRELLRQAAAAVGVSLAGAERGVAAQLKHFVAENVALIRNVGNEYLGRVEREALASMSAGERHEDLAERLEEAYQVSASRAQLIARDQTLKFNGTLNRVRQQNMGVSQYIWHTVEDSRVRAVHADRDGETYDWSDPPGDPEDPATGGHPGQAINCRCWAEPVFVDEED